MILPSFLHTKIVDKDGYPTEDFKNFLTNLVMPLQQNLSNEGYKLPFQTEENIAILDNPKSTGMMLYDEKNNVVKVNLNGTYKTVQTA